MQLVIKYGAKLFGGTYDIVMASYPDDFKIDLRPFPGCRIIPFEGDLGDLDRVGPDFEGAVGVDTRQHIAPHDVDLVAYAGMKRYLVEVGGIELNGMRIPTDREVSQPKILGGYVKALANPDYKIENFKIGPGNFVTLDNATVVALGDAVEAHIQACFTAEAAVSADVASGKVGTLAQVDAAFSKLSA